MKTASAQSRHTIAATAFAFVTYLIASLMFFGRMLPGHLTDYYVGRNTDPSNYMWALAWWPYVLRHHVHPFLTRLIDAPFGMNLASAPAPLPLLGIMMTPLTTALGPIATYNLISLILPPLAALTAFSLCRKLSGSFVAALLGGFVFGFSPYVIGQLLSHMNLLLIFPIPLAVYLVVCRVRENIGRNLFIGLLTTVLSVQFLLILEPFAMMAFMAVVTLLIAMRVASSEDRGRILRLIPEIAAAYLFTILLMTPYFYFFFAYGFPTRPLWPSIMYSADVLNFIVPTSANAIGNLAPLQKLSANFPGNIFEQGACLGMPLLAIAALWSRRHRGELMPKLLIATIAASCILALGPFLQIGGHPALPMPWLLVEKLPLIKGALPIRLVMYAFLALAVIFTMWFCDPRTGSTEKVIGTIATLIMLMPNPSASFWASRVPLPAILSRWNLASSTEQRRPCSTVALRPEGNGDVVAGLQRHELPTRVRTERFAADRDPTLASSERVLRLVRFARAGASAQGVHRESRNHGDRRRCERRARAAMAAVAIQPRNYSE